MTAKHLELISVNIIKITMCHSYLIFGETKQHFSHHCNIQILSKLESQKCLQEERFVDSTAATEARAPPWHPLHPRFIYFIHLAGYFKCNPLLSFDLCDMVACCIVQSHTG